MTPLTRTTTPAPWPGWSRLRAAADLLGNGSGGSCSIQGVTPPDEDLLVAAPDIVAVYDALGSSRRIVVRAAGSIAGHESDPCPFEHPLVGRRRCGEWLLFAGVHDLMHVAQLRAIAATRLPEVTA